MKLGNNILCDELILMYKNHIEPNLIEDEIFYSPLLEMKFLNLWKKFTITHVPKYTSNRSNHNRNCDLFECYYRNGETLMITLYIINNVIILDHVYSDFDYLLLKQNIDTTNLVIRLIEKHKLNLDLYYRFVNNAL